MHRRQNLLIICSDQGSKSMNCLSLNFILGLSNFYFFPKKLEAILLSTLTTKTSKNTIIAAGHTLNFYMSVYMYLSS